MPRGDLRRVGYVLKRYPRYSETFILSELLAHQAAGLDVEIFALHRPNEPERQPEADLIRFPVTYLDTDLRGAARDTAQTAALTCLAAERGIDLFHAHFATSATTVARAAASRLGVPYTFTAHAKDIYHEGVDQQELAGKLRDAARVVTVSEYNRDHLLQRFDLGSTQVVRIYNGLDLDRYPAQWTGRNARVLAVGRLVEKKGFAVLLEALQLLKSEHNAVGCDLVGAGPLDDTLHQQISHLGLADLVTMTGPLGRDRVADLMRRSGAFVAPCVVSGDGDRDGLPTVLLEAMASGIPVISTPVTGIPEIVEDSSTGRLVAERDPVGLARAIADCLTDRTRSFTLARRARARIEHDFEQQRTAAALRQVFHVAHASQQRVSRCA